MSSSPELRLAADFEPATRDAWRRLALTVLAKSGVLDAEPGDSGEQVEEALATRTYDGITLAALYAADNSGPTGSAAFRAAHAGWDVRQLHSDPDATATHSAALTDLDNGVTSLWFRFGDGRLAVDDLSTVLEGVLLDLAPIALDAGAESPAAGDALLALAANAGVSPTALAGTIGFDPIGLAARTGGVPDVKAMIDFAPKLAAYPHLALATVDGTAFHEAGGSDAQELGFALSVAVAYLRALTDSGFEPTVALSMIELRLAASADQFATIAKMRAARRAWARIAEVCGAEAPARSIRIHAVTSSAMMTSRDPWVNMLRGTLACFGAGVGGADSVTVLPFDSAIGLPDDFARRIARNTHALLQLESHVARVIDPARGSWYVERLTADLAQAAWAVFTATEAAGGIEDSLAKGSVSAQLDATWALRSSAIAHRRDPITGVSEFPHLDEVSVARRPHPTITQTGLPKRRYAEPFEHLRTRADLHAEATGARPLVMLATLGPLATHTGRASFAANLFAAGGISTVAAGPTATKDIDVLASSIAEAFTKSGASVACLCSSDKVYAAAAAPVSAALIAAGARAVWLAGPQGNYSDVTDYIYAGCDAVAALTAALEQLGVAP